MINTRYAAVLSTYVSRQAVSVLFHFLPVVSWLRETDPLRYQLKIERLLLCLYTSNDIFSISKHKSLCKHVPLSNRVSLQVSFMKLAPGRPSVSHQHFIPKTKLNIGKRTGERSAHKNTGDISIQTQIQCRPLKDL